MSDLPKQIKNIVPIPHGLTAEQVVEPETLWSLKRDLMGKIYYRSNGPVTAEVFHNVAADPRLFKPVAEWPSEGDLYDALSTVFGILERKESLMYSEYVAAVRGASDLGNVFHPETGLNPKGVSIRDVELAIQLIFGVPGFARDILSALRCDDPTLFEQSAFTEAQALLETLER